MIGKPIKGKSFGGCINYVMNREEATILRAEGVSMENAASITRDFNMQRKLNPNLSRAVGHTVLSWSEQDKAKLTDAIMIEMAEQYMRNMKITDTQYLIVKHEDRNHPHVHLIFNRVDNNGQTITDQNDYVRNTKVCRQLTEAYGLHIAENKQKVNRKQLKGSDKIRYAIYDALKEALPHVQRWDQLEKALQRKGITLQYKYKSGSKQLQGISFEKDGVKFKGSAIDRSMSVAGIEKQLRQNQDKKQSGQEQKNVPIHHTRNLDDDQAVQETGQIFDIGINLAAGVTGLLSDLLPGPSEQEQKDQELWKHRLKRKRKHSRRQG